jgi:membrane-bound serine protease (ClpP class)
MIHWPKSEALRSASRRTRLVGAAALAVFLAGSAGGIAAERGVAYMIELKGGIGVAASQYLERNLKRAEAESVALVVVAMNTPGGLVASTREIIQGILASPVPVVIYVSPAGAQAASAGTYILYAGHVAAMAPGTNVGAATPVSLGGIPGMPDGRERERDRERDGKAGEDKNERAAAGAMERKVVNDAAAFLRSLAQLRGRNVEWAEKAVREAATLTAEEAVREKVIDVLARDTDDLFAKLDGRTVMVAGAERRLVTAGLRRVAMAPDWRDKALAVITEPTVAYLLLLLGIYGLFFELWNPGFVLPGVVGGISMLLALTALAVLPVNYGGAGLIALGVILMVAEAFTPGTIALGIGGLVAFVAGSILLFEPAGLGIELALPWTVIAAASVTTGGFFLLAIGLAVRARRRAVVSGQEEMIGGRGRVIDWRGDSGRVRLHGEIWRARAAAPLAAGDAVRVVRIEGLTAVVEPDAGGT